MQKIIPSLLLAGLVGLVGNTAQAQYDNYGTTPDVVGAGLGIGLIIVWIVFMIVGLALSVFWIWMLVDAIKRPFDQKTMWIILLIILGWIGAIAYYFVIKRKNVSGGSAPRPQAPQAPPPPQTPPQA